MTVIFERKEYIHFDDKLEFTEKVEKYVREYSNNPRHNFGCTSNSVDGPKMSKNNRQNR